MEIDELQRVLGTLLTGNTPRAFFRALADVCSEQARDALVAARSGSTQNTTDWRWIASCLREIQDSTPVARLTARGAR